MGLTTPTPAQLVGWTPIRLEQSDDGPIVDWCCTERERFDDPFFDQTVERCLRHPFRLLFRHRTTMATLGQVADAGATLPLAGLIFHSSRCGSTLVSQMLGCLPSVLVLSEPGPLHSVLALTAVPEEQRVDWLRWTTAALGQPRAPEQRHLVIKLDAWAALDLPLILRAFPATPWIFVYRDPVEVLVSHEGHRGYHMVPGILPLASLGLDPGAAATPAPEVYMARVLGALLQAAARSVTGGPAMLVNYRELPGAVADRVAPWFGLETGPAEVARMAEVASRDAKNFSLAFEDDGAAKQMRASDGLRKAVAQWVEPQYQVLEAQRQRAQ